MSHDPATVVTRWFAEVWNQRRADLIPEFLTADSVCETDAGPLRGPDGFTALMYEPFLAAFPDLYVTVDGVISAGTEVVSRWTATGTHTGAGLGFAPTGRAVTFRGMTWSKVRDGKFDVGWQSSNIVDVVRGLAAPAAGG